MKHASQIISAVTIALLLGLPPLSQAQAADSCGTMLMPAAALKQVARGFTSYHSGVDLTAPYGSPVRAADAGRVVFAGNYFGYGNMIDLQNDNGTVTRYAHLSKFGKDAKIGHVFSLGEIIGNVGTSGHAHGAHLHFEVRLNGRAVDPKPFLALANCPTQPGIAIEEASAREGRPGGFFQ
jgi:murein DD-endopeptidase MepM/ murein hydrolase activator NlpD